MTTEATTGAHPRAGEVRNGGTHNGTEHPGAPGPRSRRHHPPGDAERSAHGTDHRRRHRRRLPPRRRRRRRGTARRAPRRPGARGLRLVQPHLRQRLARPVAAPPAVHGGQPRPLDAPHQRGPPAPDRTPVRPPGTARRAQPHRAAGRGRLRGRPRPHRLAVRGHPACAARHSWLGFLSPTGSDGGWWSAPGRRLRPGRAGADRPHRAALVPLPPHLERLRVPAATAPGRGRRRAHRRRRRNGDLPGRARPPRLLVRTAGSWPGCAPPTPPPVSSPSPRPSAPPPPVTTTARAAPRSWTASALCWNRRTW